MLVSFIWHMILAVLFIKRFEINQPICLGSGLSVEAKEKTRCVILFSFCFTIFREEVAVWQLMNVMVPLKYQCGQHFVIVS